MITIIAAISENGIIGNKGSIPWHLNKDLKYFKQLTIGYPCIMGRKTYESLPIKPLPNRENIILSTNIDSYKGAIVFRKINDVISFLNGRDAYIIGGYLLYKIGLEIANEIKLTKIYKKYNGDTFFPEIDMTQWKLTSIIPDSDIDILSGKIVNFCYLTYTRKTNEYVFI